MAKNTKKDSFTEEVMATIQTVKAPTTGEVVGKFKGYTIVKYNVGVYQGSIDPFYLCENKITDPGIIPVYRFEMADTDFIGYAVGKVVDVTAVKENEENLFTRQGILSLVFSELIEDMEELLPIYEQVSNKRIKRKIGTIDGQNLVVGCKISNLKKNEIGLLFFKDSQNNIFMDLIPYNIAQSIAKGDLEGVLVTAEMQEKEKQDKENLSNVDIWYATYESPK